MARINPEKIEEFSKRLVSISQSAPAQGMNFYSIEVDGREVVLSDMYPRLGHIGTIDFFFFVCLHQHGFWYSDERGYAHAMHGTFDGKRRKGSDIVWRSAMKALSINPNYFSPSNLAELSLEQFSELFRDDYGEIQFPEHEERYKATLAYANWFLDTILTPREIVLNANDADETLRSFLRLTADIPGFDCDRLLKKNLLLAMTLASRPEKFLLVNDEYNWMPIVDYHLMRVALRLGLVELDDDQVELNENRLWVSEKVERDIREKVFQAVAGVIGISGLTVSFVDEKMWMARKYCPEMSRPNCDECLFVDVCEKRIRLFQPVFRTKAY